MSYSPSLDEVRSRCAAHGRAAVYRELLADTETPVSAYLKLAGDGPGFLLESVENGERSGRFSFLGAAPRATLTYHAGSVTLARPDSCLVSTWECADPLLALRDLLGPPGALGDGLPPFCGGAVGYLGWEVAGCFEKLPRGAAVAPDVPDAMFMLCDPVLVFDHVSRTARVFSIVAADDEGGVEGGYAAALARIDAVCERLSRPLDGVFVPPSGPAGDTGGYPHRLATPLLPTLPRISALRAATAQSNVGQERHEEAVRRAIEYIYAGDAIQVVLSQRLQCPLACNSFTLYRALRAASPSPYMVYIDFGTHALVGASVETLLKVTGDKLYYHPIAGTRRRGATPDEDLALERELRHDEKERAEHVMLVDLGRNDLGRVAATGTVEVSELMAIERFSHVMHMVSTIEARLEPGLHPFDALRAAFPAGTVSGAPKIRAMEIIAELEPHGRGTYAGCAGYFDYSGDLDTAITIRTAVVQNGIAYIQAGGGIVADSDPAAEWQETMHKAGGMLRAVAVAERLTGPPG